MTNIIIGTAGHIDHGKTTLVKMLTNINTDTMKEEKERGMTIDLGFAPLTMPSGDTISIIDVPGHEKFIKNMVAGAKGIDFVLFLIACDDGIMPQTIEHKEIIKLLGVKNGIIVLSKRDLVSKERVQEIKTEISTIFSDNFFLNFPFIEVSSNNPESYKSLYNLIATEISKLKNSKQTIDKKEKHFRLDIDKIYSPKGVGTIVSGTSIGNISKLDSLTLFPQNVPIKIKGIQIHGKDSDKIESHQRCALNISGITAKELQRGNLLTNSKSIVITKSIDILFNPIFKDNIPKNNSKIRLNIGTGEYYGKLKYLEDNFTDNIFFQLLMDKDIPIDFNDIGILRTLTNSELLGGARVLTPYASPTKKNNLAYIQNLKYLSSNNFNLSEYLLSKDTFISIVDLKRQFNLNLDLKKIDDDIIFFENENLIIHRNSLQQIKSKLDFYLDNFHKNNPLKKGVPIATINNLFFNGINVSNIFENLYSYSDNFISSKSFKIKLSKEEKLIKDKILVALKTESFNGLSREHLEKIINSNLFKRIFDFLLREGLIINLENIFILKGFYNESLNKLYSHFEINKNITLAEYRDVLGCSRKTALIFLEHFDKKNITKKIENYRILNV
ncbi:MAG: selenocysteine-specific translation elongation factor [Cetobacterium sp.]